jgi:hypothetical protein
VSYTFQSSRDGNPLRSQNTAHSHTLRGTASMQASSDVAVSVTAGLVTSRFGTRGWETTQSLGVSPMWRPRGSSLSASVALTLSRNQTSLSIQTNLLAQYRFPAGLTATLSLRRTGFASEGGTFPDYQEYVAGLTVGYRF